MRTRAISRSHSFVALGAPWLGEERFGRVFFWEGWLMVYELVSVFSPCLGNCPTVSVLRQLPKLMCFFSDLFHLWPKEMLQRGLASLVSLSLSTHLAGRKWRPWGRRSGTRYSTLLRYLWTKFGSWLGSFVKILGVVKPGVGKRAWILWRIHGTRKVYLYLHENHKHQPFMDR